MAKPSEESTTSPRYKFHEVFQPKQGRYSDIPPAKLSEMLKSNNLDNAPTQSLLSVINGILDESADRKNGDIPDKVACLLRKVVQEIERRISTQAEHIRNQNNLFKTREEKYQSRIRVLETLATGASDETQMVLNQLQIIKTKKTQIDERQKHEQDDLAKLIKEKEENDLVVSKLKYELEIKNKIQEDHRLQLEKKVKEATVELLKEKESSDIMVAKLMAELEVKNHSHEEQRLHLEAMVKESTDALVKQKESSDRMVKNLKEEIEIQNKLHREQLQQLGSELVEAKGVLKDKESIDMEIVKFKEEAGKRYKVYEERCIQLEDKIKEAKEDLTKEKLVCSSTVTKLEVTERNKKLYEEQCLRLEVKLREANKELDAKKSETELLLTDSIKRTQELELLKLRNQEWTKKESSHQNFVRIQLNILKDLRMSSDSIKKEVVNNQNACLEDFTRLRRIFKELAGVAETSHIVQAENRRLYNEVQELKGNIRVLCRIRPFLSEENTKATVVDYISENGEVSIVNPSRQGKSDRRTFKFNKVFGPTASQEEVYMETRPLIRSTLDGFNVCIFAYGQTGSGKTYTMSGPNSPSKENLGVNYRALNDLFSISQSRISTVKYEIEVQMVEIYNEQVRDLLSNDATPKRLEIKNTSQPNGLVVPGACAYPVNSTEDVLELMKIGLANRSMSSTSLNERSSRSHSVLTVHVRGTDLKNGASLRGSLHLVDLAGSERVDRSEVTGDRLKEAQHINKSLSALGDVIFALSQKSCHIPYRNSKLTQLLQSSLGGHAKTLMFVQINPEPDSFSETSSTLKFAERVSGVELGAARSNKEGRDTKELMDQVASLKDAIMKKDEEIDRLSILRETRESTFGHSSSSLSLQLLESTSQSDQNISGQAIMGVERESDIDCSAGSFDGISEVERTTNDTKRRSPSEPPRSSPTQKARITKSSLSKPKDPQKTPSISSSPRRIISAPTTSSTNSPRRWQ